MNNSRKSMEKLNTISKLYIERNKVKINEWLKKISGRKPALKWFIVALIGGILISWMGTPEFDKPRSMFFRLSIPVLLIIYYAWNGYRDTQRISKEFQTLRNARLGQLADSVYFLGFLWTLWALIDSFVIHQLSIVESVFRAFGYALVTTTTGMFLRLTILQFSYSSDEQIPLSEEQIEKEMVRFSREIGQVVSNLRSFQKNINSAQMNWINAFSRSIRILEDKVNTISSKTDNLEKTILDKMDVSFQNVNGKMNEETNKLKKEVDKVLDIGKTFKNETETIKSSLSENTKNINENIAASIENIKNATRSLSESLPEQIQKIETNLNEVANRINNIRISPDIIESTLINQSRQVSQNLNASTLALDVAIKNYTQTVQAKLYAEMNGNNRWWKFWKRF